jgi:hypothetical protein
MIVNNFMIRPHSMDIFMLKQIVEICDFDKTDIQDYIDSSENNLEVIRREMIRAIRTKDFMILASLILIDIKDEHIDSMFEVATNYFVTRNAGGSTSFTEGFTKAKEWADKFEVIP